MNSGLRLRVLVVAWPAFLMAGVLEMLVFALVDPTTLRWFGGDLVDLSPLAIYSMAFLVFWWVIGIAGGITQLLQISAGEVNATSPPGQPARWPAH
ncbi:MAG: hypothetical protein KA164_22390 [Rhodoferax sp.]|nr:hypothetical protein [Rhodoferax sp.]